MWSQRDNNMGEPTTELHVRVTDRSYRGEGSCSFEKPTIDRVSTPLAPVARSTP